MRKILQSNSITNAQDVLQSFVKTPAHTVSDVQMLQSKCMCTVLKHFPQGGNRGDGLEREAGGCSKLPGHCDAVVQMQWELIERIRLSKPDSLQGLRSSGLGRLGLDVRLEAHCSGHLVMLPDQSCCQPSATELRPAFKQDTR